MSDESFSPLLQDRPAFDAVAPLSLEDAGETRRRVAARFESWPPTIWPDRPVRTKPPSRLEVFEMRLAILLATASLLALLVWLLMPARIGNPFLYTGLTLAMGLRAIGLLFEWHNYWVISAPTEIQPRRTWTVDILTTACPGEPAGMIVRTLKAMVAIRLPHTNYLCDEGNDPYLKSVCEALGVVHVTRTDKTGAKAGNINNALRQATGQIAVVLDPDHDPAPYLLERTLGYFEDPAVGFVQSVQAYGNQGDSFVARAAAQQSYHFYGPFMMGTNRHGTTQAIGANCVFRRAALDSIGGHAAGLAEDMHTAMQLYAKGWRSIYVPEILTRGLVPSTLPSFYKQQLKWACGVFDLLFQKYPGLFGSFTWRQALHYFLCPIFFLRGFIVLLEMAVPVLCLTLGLIAWRAPLEQIAAWFLPLLIFSTLVRLRAQRWLTEPHEPGMHSPAGLLTTGTWWIYCVGVLCAVFRVKIPYIPTAKEDVASDCWRVCWPNFLASGILIGAVIYGLDRDSSPSAWLMAFLAGVNALALLYVSFAVQQVTLRRVKGVFLRVRGIFRPLRQMGKGAMFHYRIVLSLVRWGWTVPIAASLITMALFFAAVFHPWTGRDEVDRIDSKELDTGGFYTGIDLGGISDSQRLGRLASLEKQADFHFRLVSLDVTWSPTEAFPLETLKQLRRQGAVPLINWLPTGIALPQPPAAPAKVTVATRSPKKSHKKSSRTVIAASNHPATPRPAAEPVLKMIAEGKLDDYLRKFADQVRDFGEPVLISLAPQPDNPRMPWSISGGNSSDDFILAWRRMARLFDAEGAANAGWVWKPWSAATMGAYFPGESGEGFVDWIALSMGNDGTARSFAERYRPFRDKVGSWRMPIMLTDLDSIPAGATRDPEIKAAIFRTASPDIASQLAVTAPFRDGAARPPPADQPFWFDLHPQPPKLTSIKGGPGHFTLMADGAPFYIKGIAYNASHDWFDATLPLSRTEFDTDFSAIQAMGGNTIRRYGSTWSDRVILNSAAQHHLKVLYGFWFMQDIDYLKNTSKERAYQREIESTVSRYRDHSSILGWSLGNEVWGLLKHHYAQPYLTEVRHAHVLFVERMAERIKQLDPTHPVFSAQESAQIAGADSDYSRGAPALDGLCVNTYYQRDIAGLARTLSRIDPSRPYIISEFGPDGYWEDSQNHYDKDAGLLEDTAYKKASLYADRWREFIQGNQGKTLGGMAYCWSDRYEGTATWFGLTDLDGRAKPAIAALQDAWQHPDPHLGGHFPYAGPKIQGLDYPTAPQWPHEPFLVKAHVDPQGDKNPQYLWTVTGPNFRTGAGWITKLNAGDSVSIELPSTPGWYRIQLKVVGKFGLDEANVPVLVKAADFPDATRPQKLLTDAPAPSR